MSQGKIWAKVVNDEIMQLHDEDPSGLWHPEALTLWEEVPAECHIGWKRDENGEWHNGEWWYEKNLVDNPVPPPGPPSAGIAVRRAEFPDRTELTFTHAIHSAEEFSHEWVISGETYTTEEVSLTITKVEDTIQKLKVKLTATNSAGSTSSEEIVEIGPWAPPVAAIEI